LKKTVDKEKDIYATIIPSLLWHLRSCSSTNVPWWEIEIGSYDGDMKNELEMLVHIPQETQDELCLWTPRCLASLQFLKYQQSIW
jgi:hypothetical protein